MKMSTEQFLEQVADAEFMESRDDSNHPVLKVDAHFLSACYEGVTISGPPRIVYVGGRYIILS